MTRYFPQAATTYLGMTSLRNPANGQALVNVAQVLADPKWLADVPASAANLLASAVGWLNVGNLASGVLGMSLGFVITIAVSLLGKTPPGADDSPCSMQSARPMANRRRNRTDDSLRISAGCR